MTTGGETMTADVIATVLTGVGVLLGVWRLLAAYEARNDAAHAALSTRIDTARAELGGRIDRLYELLIERLPKAAP